jgi:hypothetical protein
LDKNATQQAVPAPGNGTTKSTTKHIPQSRLYWEIKAEQTLNKVFDQYQVVDGSAGSKSFTDVEVIDFVPSNQEKRPEGKIHRQEIVAINAKLWLAFAVSSLAAILGIAVLQMTRERQTFKQESDIRLIALLRQAQPTAPDHNIDNMENNKTMIPTPPTPPAEEWIQELAKLPPSVSTTTELLKVPLNGTLKSSATQIPISTNLGRTPKINGSPMPQLLGIIQGNGTAGSAIFQWEGSSANARAGETIGASGWRLRTTNGDSAIIERGGQQQRLSLNSQG